MRRLAGGCIQGRNGAESVSCFWGYWFSMSKIAATLHESGVNSHEPTREDINRQLAAILASPVFHGSRRCQQFLEYVCEKSLAGEGGTIKERMIAVDVFGRAPQTDLGEDTIVRVGAREVRKRLAQYYVTPEGAAAEMRIELPPGSYVPEFHYVSAAPEEIAPAPPPVVLRSDWWNKTAVRICGLAIVIALTVFAFVKLTGPSPNIQEFRRFWEPVLKSDEPLLIAVAHPIVYHASGRAIRLSEQNLPPQDVPMQRALQVQPNELTGADFVPVFNQYVGFGDMVAANEVTAMLARKSKGVRVRMASNVGFADLRKAQTLLIGAVTNRWTVELQQSWRFRFSWTPGTRTVIVDTREPDAKTVNTGEKRQWSIQSTDDGSAPDDYVLVSRIGHGYTGGFVLVAAGLKQFGTEAAGRLIADPEQLGAILRKLPAGWESKNVQLVLHVRVIGNTPAQPEVLASHVW
jgi:hypothetical protein